MPTFQIPDSNPLQKDTYFVLRPLSAVISQFEHVAAALFLILLW